MTVTVNGDPLTEIWVYDEEIPGKAVADTFCINTDICVNDFNFWVADTAEEDGSGGWLSLAPQSTTNGDSLIDVLQTNDKISENMACLPFRP